MKAGLFFLCTLGAASATFLVKEGEEHVFSYTGKIVSGIPELTHTFSGLAIECEVLLQAHAGQSGNNPLTIALKDVKFVNFNEELTHNQGRSEELAHDWRTVATPVTSPVPEEMKVFLESPIEVLFKDYEVKKITLSSEEPEWSVNFKKALVSAIKVQLPVQDKLTNRIPRASGNSMVKVPTFWTVMEQGIDGVCEAMYQVTEISKYLEPELVASLRRIEPKIAHSLIKTELCEGKKMFQVVRTRDISKCTARSLYIASRTHDNCVAGNCNGVSSKVSSTRFLGCGEDMETFQLHAIVNEGELQQNLMAFNTEQVLTGTQQVLALKEVKTAHTALPKITAPRTVEDLLYEYPKSITPEERQQMKNFKTQQDYYNTKAQDPKNHILTLEGGSYKAMTSEQKTKVVEIYTRLAAGLNEMEHFGQKQITNELKAMKTFMFVRTTEEIKTLYNEVKNNKVVRRLFLDTVMMAGTNPSVMFIKEMIETNEFHFLEIAEYLMTMPHYVKAPTAHLVEEIFQLIKSPAVTAHKLLKNNANIMFGSIVNMACSLEQRPQYSYPEVIHGDRCSASNPKIVSEYIPYLVKELQSASQAEKISALLALGAIGHKGVVHHMMPYIEGSATQSVTLRKMAIYALAGVTHEHRGLLLPVYTALVHNPVEHRDVRIAALSMVLLMRPDTIHMQKIAVSTWFEKDQIVAKFIYSALKSLSQIKRQEVPAGSPLLVLANKATTVLPLVKTFPGIMSMTSDVFMAGFLNTLNVGYTGQSAQTYTPNSFMHYYRLEMYLKQAKTVPMEYAVTVGGLKNLMIDTLKEVTGSTQVHQEFRKIIEQLEITPKSETPIEASFWARFANDMQFAIMTPEINSEYIKEKVKSIMNNPAQYIDNVKKVVCGKTPIAIYKAVETLPYFAMVPSEMGFPIFTESAATVLVGLKGEVNVDCATPLPSLEVKMTKKMAYTWSGYVGTVSPFGKKLLAAGIDTHRAINMPVQAKLRIDPATASIKVEMKQLDEVTSRTSAVDFLHYHVMPFTTMKPLFIEDFTPIIKDITNTKIIRIEALKNKLETTVGQELGLDIKLEMESEGGLLDKKALMDTLRNYHYNPLVALQFIGTETAVTPLGKPTIRYHKYTLIHNPKMSTTKAMEIDIKLAAAIKNNLQIIKHIASISEKKSKHEEKISTSLNSSPLKNSETAYIANALIEIKLVGGPRRTYEYAITAAKGTKEQVHKWNLVLEAETEPKMICVTGEMEFPVTRTLAHNPDHFKFQNKIGFGTTCEESFVKLVGMTKTSERQRSYSRRSEAARECEKLSREVIQIYSLISSASQQEKASLEREHSEKVARKEIMCERMVKEQKTLDQVEMEITTSPRLPEQVIIIGKYLDSIVKSYLIEYIAKMPNFEQKTSGPIKVILGFNQRTASMNMEIASPMDTTMYRDIRLPTWTQEVFPLTYSRSALEQGYWAVTGESLNPRCSISEGHVQTFDKAAYSYQLDNCYHLLTSDCSKRNSQAVLAKETDNVKHIKIIHQDTMIELKEPSTRYSRRSASSYKLEVNGEEVEVRPEQAVEVRQGCWVHWSRDNKITVETPAHRVQYGGKVLSVQEKSFALEQSCGLCGNNDQNSLTDLRSPQQCVYRSYKAMCQSWRIQDSHCISKLSNIENQRLAQEKKDCIANRAILSSYSPSSVSSSSYLWAAKKEWRHAVIFRANMVCISRERLAECSLGSVVKAIETKEVKFVCLPSASRNTKDLVKRVQLGQEIPELKNLQGESFSSRVEEPKECSQE